MADNRTDNRADNRADNMADNRADKKAANRWKTQDKQGRQDKIRRFPYRYNGYESYRFNIFKPISDLLIFVSYDIGLRPTISL